TPDPQGTPIAEASRDLPLVPLREAVVFPKLVVPLGVGRAKSVAAIDAAMSEEKHYIVLAAQRDAEVDDVAPEQIYCMGRIAELATTAKNTQEPGHFADLVASTPDLTLEQRQQLLEMTSVVERLKFLSVFLAKQNEILELKAKIQSEVQQTLDKTQREYILRE